MSSTRNDSCASVSNMFYERLLEEAAAAASAMTAREESEGVIIRLLQNFVEQ